jgi:hypothetical protein
LFTVTVVPSAGNPVSAMVLPETARFIVTPEIVTR